MPVSKSLKALQDYTYTSRYARYIEKLNRRETWDESIDRTEEMYTEKFPDLIDDIKWAFSKVRTKDVLGSQRALQFAGDPIKKHNARIYNCTASYCDRLRFFQETMYLLLCGCGVGFSAQKHHVDKMPSLYTKQKRDKIQYVIDDSIEGWSDSIGVLISSYFENPIFPEFYGCDITFDYSQIRPKGSLFSHGVGKAPGPDGLRNSHEQIIKLLNRCLSNNQTKLRPIDAYDIVMHCSDAVLSGGVRRSATICLFSPDDEEMMNAKIGSWNRENPQRGRSNNSAVLLRNSTTKEQFLELMKRTKEFGEPGFVWADSLEAIFNPCLEVGMYAYDKDGNSGWQMCNLAEINGRRLSDKNKFKEIAKAASIIGTLQASYTSFPYLGKVTEDIVKREALIGVSITGMMDSPEVIFNPEIQKEVAKYILEINKEFAKKIGINPAARTTCIKPAGTTSCILGTSSGIHPHHAKRYFRRIQANKEEATLAYFRLFNPKAIEESVWSNNHTDDVITFCVEVPEGSRTKNQISAIELLEYIKLTQNNWVKYGKDESLCTQPWLAHNVSNTVHVLPDEWKTVSDFIYKNREYFTGVSFLPISGDKDYQQPPFCTVYTPREIVQTYGDASIFASGIIEKALEVFDYNLWDACDAVLGLIRVKPGGAKSKWVNSAKRFAKHYFDGDVRKMAYCLKDVYNWKLWLDLTREYQDVDYTKMYESEDNTQMEESVACSGGTCEIMR